MRKGTQTVENKKYKSKKNNDGKIVIKDKAKFMTFILVAIIILIVIIVIVTSGSNGKIDEDTDISKLNAQKYSEQIKAEYEAEGKDSVFMEDWNQIQDATARYLIENFPEDNTKSKELIEEIAKILDSEDWSKLNIEKNSTWNGKWNIDENGRVNFKFANEKIEPTWALTLSDQGYVVLN